jgi:glucose-6-phosphate isomerase
MKNIKKLKEVINGYDFLEIQNKDLLEYNKLNIFDNFSTILLIGIGGSWLGAELLTSYNLTNKKVIFLNTIQPKIILEITTSLDLKNTCVLIQSKSGSTLETRTCYEYFKDLYQQNNLQISNHFIYVSDQDTFLKKESNTHESIFIELNKNIGGRYSALTCMGLILAKLLNIDLQEFKIGSQLCLSNLDIIEELTQGCINNNIQKIVLFNYNYKLTKLNDWFIQLIAESLGKEGKELTPISAVGVRDQHSILQMLSEGNKDKLVIFIPPILEVDLKIPKFNFTFNQLLEAEYHGTYQDLSNIHKVFELKQLNLSNNQYLGYIITFFEIFTAYYGYLNEINPFNQNGVENSKIITKKILKIN